MEHAIVNGIKIYGPSTRKEFLESPEVLNHKLVAMNAEKIMSATDDLRKLYGECVNYPDGVGAVWALKKKKVKDPVKIPGCELWLDFIKNYETTKSFYFIGGTDDVIERTIAKLKGEFKALNIAGYRNGFIKTPEEKALLIEDIRAKKPDFVFVAMGSPRQELLIGELFQQHVATYQGLGGSFDVYIGHVKRAPQAWVKLNLEWAYRLFKQPKRILRQYKLLFFLLRLKLNRY